MRMGATKELRKVSYCRSLNGAAGAYKALLLVATLTLATIVNGCAGMVSASNSPNQGTGAIQLNPTSLNFGNIGVGKLSSQTITVANTGTASINVTQATVSNSQFKISGITLPMAMSAGQSGAFTVSVTPSASGSITGTLTVQGDAGSPAVVNLSADAVASTGNLQANQTSLSFGSVTNGSSVTKQVVLTNTGAAAVQISGLSVAGAGFSLSGITTPNTLNPSATATLSVKFAPNSTGAVTGSATVTSNAPGSPLVIALSGTGTASPVGNLQANQSSLSFGNVNTGASSVKQVILTNSGTAAVHISAVAATGTGVSVNGIATPTTLNPSATATLSVTFAPTAAGSVTGSVTVTSDAPGSPLTIPVSGAGAQPGISVSPTSFNFGSIVNGQTSTKSFTVTNSGSATLTISQLSISATGYSVNGLSVPSTVAPGSSVSFNAVFAPTTTGSLPGTVNIASNAPNSPATVALNGTGVAATKTLSFSSSNLAFGNVSTSTPSTLTETITNTGNSAVQISAITVSGTGYSLSGAGAVTLNPSQTFTFSVIFDPSAAGSANGSIVVASNATGSPATITLSGTGVVATTHTVSLTWNETGSSIAGYNVYRSTTSGSGYVKLNGALVPNMNYTDSSVQNTTTYFYVTTAVDGSGNESAFSNEASAVVPN
jgi:hypothetical protein